MYKYKRKIDELNNIRKSSFVLSDKVDTVVSLNSDFSVSKPFHGLYIKNGKVVLSNVFEEIETKENKYDMLNISSMNSKSDEYISSIDLENLVIEYDMNDFFYRKKIYLEEKTGILAIEYNIKNKSKHIANFRAIPAITYRELYNMKNSSMLKFNQRNDKNGVVINLSITNNQDIVLESDKLSWNKDVNILHDVKYNVRINDNDIKSYVEDLSVPGYFEISIKPNLSTTCVIYITSKKIDITKLSTEELSKKDFFLRENIANSIENEYVELKELAYGIEKTKLEDTIVSSLPYNSKDTLTIKDIKLDNNNLDNILDILIDQVRAIEGQYLTFGKVKEATKVVVNTKKYIDYISSLDISEYKIKYKLILLKLWCIESINRIVQKQDLFSVFFDFTNKLIYSILDDELCGKYFENIEAICLMYNSLKIYEDMIAKKGIEEKVIFAKINELHEKIKNDFWNEDLRVMKKNLQEEETYANVEMLYTISLSYPCIIGDIQFKLLDTVFKELYTPYGLREYSKNSTKNTGIIYPKYMAHFVKANLRQNGVTRASQKIAFNLAKELLLDINKYINCGIRKTYSEKGFQIDTFPYDLLTNAEVIRLYDMLT